jgi:hypothetical protein
MHRDHFSMAAKYFAREGKERRQKDGIIIEDDHQSRKSTCLINQPVSVKHALDRTCFALANHDS